MAVWENDRYDTILHKILPYDTSGLPYLTTVCCHLQKIVKSEEARSSETRRVSSRTEAGVEFLGRGQLAPLPTSYRVWERGVSSLSGVRGKPWPKLIFMNFYPHRKRLVQQFGV